MKLVSLFQYNCMANNYLFLVTQELIIIKPSLVASKIRTASCNELWLIDNWYCQDFPKKSKKDILDECHCDNDELKLHFFIYQGLRKIYHIKMFHLF